MLSALRWRCLPLLMMGTRSVFVGFISRAQGDGRVRREHWPMLAIIGGFDGRRRGCEKRLMCGSVGDILAATCRVKAGRGGSVPVLEPKVAELRARTSRSRLVGTPTSVKSVAEGHAIAKEVRHALLHHLRYLSSVIVHVDPTGEAGEEFHRIVEHSHNGLAVHSH